MPDFSQMSVSELDKYLADNGGNPTGGGKDFSQMSVEELDKYLAGAAVPPKPSSGFGDALWNTGVDVAQGVGDVANTVPGLATMVPGLHYAAEPIYKGIRSATDWVGEKLHTQPWLDEEKQMRDERAAAGVAAGGGFGGEWEALKTGLGQVPEHPGQALGTAARAIPQLFGMKWAQALIKQGAEHLIPSLAERMAANPALAAAIGEGTVTAGQIAGDIASDESNPFMARYLAPVAGAFTGAIGYGANKLLPQFGDVDVAMVNGFTSGERALAAKAPLTGFQKAAALPVAMGKEGVIEEGTQSINEQFWQNLASGNPLYQGMGESASQGIIGGSAIGSVGGVSTLIDDKHRSNMAKQLQENGYVPVGAFAPADLLNGLENRDVANYASQFQDAAETTNKQWLSPQDEQALARAQEEMYYPSGMQQVETNPAAPAGFTATEEALRAAMPGQTVDMLNNEATDTPAPAEETADPLTLLKQQYQQAQVAHEKAVAAGDKFGAHKAALAMQRALAQAQLMMPEQNPAATQGDMFPDAPAPITTADKPRMSLAEAQAAGIVDPLIPVRAELAAAKTKLPTLGKRTKAHKELSAKIATLEAQLAPTTPTAGVTSAPQAAQAQQSQPTETQQAADTPTSTAVDAKLKALEDQINSQMETGLVSQDKPGVVGDRKWADGTEITDGDIHHIVARIQKDGESGTGPFGALFSALAKWDKAMARAMGGKSEAAQAKHMPKMAEATLGIEGDVTSIVPRLQQMERALGTKVVDQIIARIKKAHEKATKGTNTAEAQPFVRLAAAWKLYKSGELVANEGMGTSTENQIRNNYAVEKINAEIYADTGVENTALKDKLKGGVLPFLADAAWQGFSPATRALAQMLHRFFASTGNHIKVETSVERRYVVPGVKHFVPQGTPGAQEVNGYYDKASNTVYIFAGGHNMRTVLHELLHAAVQKAIAKGVLSPAVQQLRSTLADFVKRHADGKSAEYKAFLKAADLNPAAKQRLEGILNNVLSAFKNATTDKERLSALNEFVAYGMTNLDFQMYMKALGVKQITGKHELALAEIGETGKKPRSTLSLWSRFTNALSWIIGGKAWAEANPTVFSQFLSDSAGLFESSWREGSKTPEGKAAQKAILDKAQAFRDKDKAEKAATRAAQKGETVEETDAPTTPEDEVEDDVEGEDWEYERPDEIDDQYELGAVQGMTKQGNDWIGKTHDFVHKFVVQGGEYGNLEGYHVLDKAGELVGQITLGLKEGAPNALYFIESFNKGTSGVEMLRSALAASPNGLYIVNMLPKSVGFWQKMGVQKSTQNKEWEHANGFLDGKTHGQAYPKGLGTETKSADGQSTEAGASLDFTQDAQYELAPPSVAASVGTPGTAHDPQFNWIEHARAEDFIAKAIRAVIPSMYSENPDNRKAMQAIDAFAANMYEKLKDNFPAVAKNIAKLAPYVNLTAEYAEQIGLFKLRKTAPLTPANELYRFWKNTTDVTKVAAVFNYMEELRNTKGTPKDTFGLTEHEREIARKAKDAMDSVVEKAPDDLKARFEGLSYGNMVTVISKAEDTISHGFGLKNLKSVGSAGKPIMVPQSLIVNFPKKAGKFYAVSKTGVNGEPEIIRIVPESDVATVQANLNAGETLDTTRPYVYLAEGQMDGGERAHKFRPVATVESMRQDGLTAETIGSAFLNTINTLANANAFNSFTQWMTEVDEKTKKPKHEGLVYENVDDARAYDVARKAVNYEKLGMSKADALAKAERTTKKITPLPLGKNDAKQSIMKDAYRAPGEWVQVPQSKNMGALAGKIVSGPAWAAIVDATERTPLVQFELYNSALTGWKAVKTIYNPPTAVGNFMSNFALAWMNNIPIRTVKKSIGLYAKYAMHPESLSKEERQIMDAFHKSGATLGSWTTSEVRKVLTDAMLRSTQTHGQGVFSMARTAMNLTQSMEAAIAVKAKQGQWAAAKIHSAMTEVYAAGDNVFRLASFMSEMGNLQRKGGYTQEQMLELAARKAQEEFLNYDIDAKWVKMARQTVLPFVSFTYASAKRMAQIAKESPWKIAEVAVIYHIAQAALLALSGDDDDEDERKRARDRMTGKTWFGANQNVRIPVGEGKTAYLELARWIPTPVSFKDSPNEYMGFLPQSLTPGGPLLDTVAAMAGVNLYTGKSIHKSTATDVDKFYDSIGALTKVVTPSSVYGVVTAKPDSLGNTPDLGATVAKALTPYKEVTDVAATRTQKNALKAVERDYNIDMSSLKKQRNTRQLDHQEFADKRAELIKWKQDRLRKLRTGEE